MGLDCCRFRVGSAINLAVVFILRGNHLVYVGYRRALDLVWNSGAVCCFLAFRLFSYTGVLIESSAQMFLMWRQLLLVGFLGGVLNGLGIMLIYWIEGAPEVMIMSRLLGYIAGDTIGAFVLLLGVLWVSRVWRKVS